MTSGTAPKTQSGAHRGRSSSEAEIIAFIVSILVTNLTGTANQPLRAGQFGQTHWSSCVKFLC